MNTITQKNNFDLIRLVLALVVFLFHVSELTGKNEFHFMIHFANASVAVHSFFIVSGFLIFMSYERSKSVKQYFSKRLKRIAPGYIAVILLCFLFLSLLSKLPAIQYFSSPESAKYLLANLSMLNFIHPNLPGVFDGHRYTSVNGALWTIKVELAFYLIVPIIARFCKITKPVAVLTIIFILSAVYFFAATLLYKQSGDPIYLTLQRQLPGQLMFFAGGALIYYYFELFKRYSVAILIPAVFGFLLYDPASYLLYPVYSVSLSVIVIYLALIFPYMGHIARYGDLSYGIYIWHFPIIQTFISMGFFDSKPWIAFIFVSVTILAVSMISWHLIEKPFLSEKSHYVKEETS